MILNVFSTLGKKVERKDRPCLIEFRDGLVKNAVMDLLSKLANAEDKYRKLSIAHDMSKLERAELKKLLAETKDKESNEGGNGYSRFEETQKACE